MVRPQGRREEVEVKSEEVRCRLSASLVKGRGTTEGGGGILLRIRRRFVGIDTFYCRRAGVCPPYESAENPQPCVVGRDALIPPLVGGTYSQWLVGIVTVPLPHPPLTRPPFPQGKDFLTVLDLLITFCRKAFVFQHRRGSASPSPGGRGTTEGGG